MSYAGRYLKTAVGIFNSLEEGKPHSSITDWVEVLSSDRYEELSLDGIPELVESINIQGAQGTQVRPIRGPKLVSNTTEVEWTSVEAG
jgi:hypothetical protein